MQENRNMSVSLGLKNGSGFVSESSVILYVTVVWICFVELLPWILNQALFIYFSYCWHLTIEVQGVQNKCPIFSKENSIGH